jgi:hypothetical protein
MVKMGWDKLKRFLAQSNTWTGTQTFTAGALAVPLTDYQNIPIEALIDGTTAPAVAATITATNSIVVRKFQGATADMDGFFTWTAPADLTGTTFTYRVNYMITESTVPANNETVVFGLSGVAIGAATASYTTDQLLSHAQGTAVKVTDTYLTATLPAQYAWSAAVTATHLAAGKTVVLYFYRNQATDTYAQNVGVSSIDLKFTRTLA